MIEVLIFRLRSTMVGIVVALRMNFLVFRWSYKGLRLTVNFLQLLPRSTLVRSGQAEGCVKKTKVLQRFREMRRAVFVLHTHGSFPHPESEWQDSTVFRWFYKGLRLTVNFSGAISFLASAKCWFL